MWLFVCGSLALCLLVAWGSAVVAQGLRVVDSVAAGVASDEAIHHYAGSDTTTGETGGRKWRSAGGWLSYVLRIYDDSPLTVVVVVTDGGDDAEAFDVIVDGRRASTFRRSWRAKAAELRVTLDLKDTQGRTSVTVKLAAHPGSRTARLVELRTIQEHLE